MSGLTEADRLTLRDVLYARWPGDVYERLKYLEREVDRIVTAHMAEARAEGAAEVRARVEPVLTGGVISGHVGKHAVVRVAEVRAALADPTEETR